MKNQITKSLLMLAGILFFQILPLQSQTTKINHKSDCWVEFFSVQPRSMMDGLADAGWIQRSGDGNKYYLILLDSSFYSGVSWERLSIDTPLRNNGQWWAFKGDIAYEPYLFYCRELEIKFNDQGIKSIKITPLPPMSNLNNDDLGTFFNNNKLHRSKAEREKKLKEKKKK